MKPTWIFGKRLEGLLHILAWSIIIVIPIFIIYTYGNGNLRSLGHFYTNALFYGVIFYLNYLFLIPRFYFRDRKLAYLGAIFLLLILTYLLLSQVETYIFSRMISQRETVEAFRKAEEAHPGPKPPFRQFWMVNFFFTSVLIIGFSFGLAILGKFSQNEKERKELEKEKLNSELAFLKNQISPHFFFNTLNNIYALIIMDSESAQHSVLKLSRLMRYLLYESEQGKTLLSHEIDFMKNYIDLMKLRLNPRIDLKVSFPEEKVNMEFPPLLFIPFIENAFKHGVSLKDHSYIHISMEIKGNSIRFVSRNSMGDSSRPDDGQHPGIGLENVRKRLNLLFPGQHELDICQDQAGFTVNLEIRNLNVKV